MNDQAQHPEGAAPKRKGKFRESLEALLIAAAVALVIRSFVIEAFKIPSGSMIPTLSIGDHIFVNKFVYGLRLPFTKFRFLNVREPRRGDVAVFMYPVDEEKDFIKRVIGLPGDRITMHDQELLVNGSPVLRHVLTVRPDPADKRRLLLEGGTITTIPFVRGWHDFNFFEEKLGDTWHVVQYERYRSREDIEAVVPPGHFFVIGDNRDNSADSREWGYVPRDNIKGEALFVWLSLDRDQGGIRWREFGRAVH